MKKRIKLTDKELAIGMWVYIYLYIESYDCTSFDTVWVASLKQRWLEKHYIKSYTASEDFYWEHDCWLCHKYWNGNCLCCPLRTCGTYSLYDGVTYYYRNKDYQNNALEYAKRILSIIQEVEDEDN